MYTYKSKSSFNQLSVWLLTAFVIIAAAVAITCCTSPEAKLKQRDSLLTTFVTSTVNHMMDRNPDTMKASMTVLFRDELTEKVIEKLQHQDVLPHTELSIEK